MIPRFKVPVKKRDGRIVMEDAVLDPRDCYRTTRGSFSTIPVEAATLMYEVECPGGYKILKGRKGAHEFESRIYFDLRQGHQTPRNIKCPKHGTNIKYTTPVEINPRGPPHSVRFLGFVPDKITGKKKVRLIIEEPVPQNLPTQ